MEAPDTLSTTPPPQTAPPIALSNLRDDIRLTVEDLLDRLGPKAAFGEPVRHGAFTLIPVAEMRVGFGFGSGFGRNPDAPDTPPEGGGGGGGAGGRVVPRGFLRITTDAARFVPTPDVTRLALGAMALAALMTLVAGRARGR